MKENKILILVLVLSLMLNPDIFGGSIFKNLKAEIDTLFITRQNKAADKQFEGLAYKKAVEKYEKLIYKGFSPDSVRRNLAISYFKLQKTKHSEELFSDLIQRNEAYPEDIYYYAQSLKYNEKYDEADRWIEKYRELDDKDSRGNLQHDAAPVIKDLVALSKYLIEPVYFNSEYSDFGAVVFKNKVFFASARKDQAVVKYEYSWNEEPYLDIFSADIVKPELFKEATLVSKGINSRYHDGPVCYSKDGKEIFITRSNFQMGMPKYSEKKENHFMLYSAKRKEDKWDELTQLSFNSSEYSCGHPSISDDGKTLYFASDMPGGFGSSDIYYVERTDSGWSKPVNLGRDINTEGDEMFPFISKSGKLYFASNGHLGLGGLDVYMASMTGKETHGILNMGYPLNSSSDDFSLFLLPDESGGYFASNREGGKGEDDIYCFTFLEKPDDLLTFIGTTKDKITGKIILHAQVNIMNPEGEEILSAISDVHGEVKTRLKPGLYYQIHAIKNDYSETDFKWMADKTKSSGNTLSLDILLEEVKEWGVFGFIFDKESGTGVQDVEVVISDKNSNEDIVLNTDAEGKFRQLLQPETNYDILLRKENYFTRRGEFSTKDMKPGWIDVKEFIEVEMEAIQVGKTIEIPNIYYDLAKWNIRTDAALELDKVVQFMIDNESITIELGSHTDARGSNSSNQSLSQKRADSAVNYIVEHGIERNRISAKGYGESKLKNGCADGVNCSEEEHQQNRRTEIKIMDF